MSAGALVYLAAGAATVAWVLREVEGKWKVLVGVLVFAGICLAWPLFLGAVALTAARRLLRRREKE